MSTKTKSYTVDEPIQDHRVVSQDEWVAARKELLAKEKELTRHGDEVSAARRDLPWVKVDKNYVFDGPDGKVTLSDLFGGKRQLIVHHLMFAPGWKEACVGCSHSADHTDGSRQHFENVDVAFVAISRAPLADLESFKRRMGWTFDWVSSGDTSFNYDYEVSFTPEQVASGRIGYNYGTSKDVYDELPGMSVFYKDEDGSIFHTYSTYGRGLDVFLGSHSFLDITPKGRCEQGPPGSGGWLQYHDRYDGAEADGACACDGKKD